MTDTSAFLAWLAESLQRAGIPYMITGSLGSTLHGEQRSTNDVDVVIAPTQPQLDALLSSLGDDFYVSSAAAREALRNRTMFNVIHTPTGQKADFIVCKDRPFSKEEFARRTVAQVEGLRLFVVSPEDAILSKLEWCRAGQSERQFRDALGVAVVQGEGLDVEYLQKWSRELDVGDLLDRVLAAAKKRQSSG
jgi:hypothetical protein